MKYLLTVFLLLFAAQVHATTWWVSATGGTTGNCSTAQGAGDPGTYLRTIKAGIACVGLSTGAGAGHTVIVKNGTYTESLDEAHNGNFMASGTSWNNPFTLKAQNHLGATITNSDEYNLWLADPKAYFATIQDFVFDGTNNQLGNIVVSRSGGGISSVEFRNNEIKNNNMSGAGGGNAVLLCGDCSDFRITNNLIHDGNFAANPGNGYPIYNQASNSIIDGNEIYNFPAYGYHGYCDLGAGSCKASPSGNIIRNNRFHDWAGHNGGIGGRRGAGREVAVINFTGSNHQVYNNLAYRGTACISVVSSTTTVNSNTCYDLDGDTTNLSFTGLELQSDTTAKNNIFWQLNSGSTFSAAAPANVRFNLCPAIITGCSVASNPQFVSAASGNFQLSASSPAINAGAILGTPYNVDIAGTSRPQGAGYDIGAYEFGAPVSPPTPALVLALAFENGSGTTATDLSGFNNHGTLQPGVDWDNAGKYGKAVVFDGTSSIVVPNSSSLNLTAMTLEAWVNPTDVTGFKGVITKGDPYFLYAGSDAGYCATQQTALGGFNGTQTICDTSAMTTNAYTHLAVTYDGNQLVYYRNGTITSSQINTNPITPDNNNVTIGASIFGEFFTGKIDEVRIYNYARTPAQIISDMNTPLVSGGNLNSVELAPGLSIELSASSSIELGAN